MPWHGIASLQNMAEEGDTVMTYMVFSSVDAFKAATGTEEFDKSKAGLNEFLEGPPAFTSYSVATSHTA